MKNPFINALLALLYITSIVHLMNLLPHGPDPKTLLMPITMLSFFVLSAAVMGYLFVKAPLELYLENKKPEALQFFFRTVGLFAVLTAILYLILLRFR